MSKDFRASQVETSKLIASGGISGTTAGLAIYSGSIASDRSGAVSDSAIFNDVGSDVFLFVSGSKNLSTFNRENVTLFGGDIVVSGTLYAERQVIEVDGIVDGDMIVTGSLLVEPDANSADGAVFRRADGTDILVVNSITPGIEITGSLQVDGDISLQPLHYLRFNNPGDDDISIRSLGNDDLWIDGDDSVSLVADETVDMYIGGLSNTFHGANGYQSLNTGRGQFDFSVMTDNYMSLLVSGGDDSVIIGSDEINYAALGRNIAGYGSDVKIMLSGSVDSKNGSSRGVVLTTGDMVISGAIHSGRLISLEDQNSYVKVGLGNVEILSDDVVKIQHRSGETNTGADTNFFVSGSIGSRDTSTKGTSVFGGDVVISGSLHDGSGNIIYGASSPSVFINGLSGSLTQLSDGSSYLIAGANITITSASNGAITISAQDDDTLFTAGTGLNLDTNEFSINDSVVATLTGSQFSGNVGVTGSIEATSFFSGSMFKAPVLTGSLTQLHDGSSYLIAGSNITITSASNGAVTISSTDTNSTYTNGTGLNLATDAFPNTFSINDSIVATISGSTFTGVTKHNAGLSGSLTQLTDGSSYLIAGSNITISSSSNGAVTISSTGGGAGSDADWTDGGDKLFTTSSVSINTDGNYIESYGSDLFFYTSGSIDGKETSGVSAFGGDLVVSGTLYVSEKIIHEGDNNSYIHFNAPDSLKFFLDGKQFISLNSNDQNILFNAGQRNDISTVIFTDNKIAFATDAANDRVLILSGGAASSVDESKGADVNFFVSGSTLSKGTSEKGTAIFGGDLVVSGAIYTGRLAAEDTPNNSYFDLTNTVEIRSGDHVEIRPTNNLDIVTQTGAMYFGNDIIDPKATDVNFFISGSIGGKGSSSKTIAAFGGDVYTSGSAYFGSTSIFEGGIHEIYSGSSNPTGVFVHDCDNGHLFYHDSLSTNFTANFTNLNLNQSHATTLTLVLSQSATAYIPNAVQIGGAAQTIDWQGNAEPAGTSNGKDVVSFTVVNVAGSYIVLGQLVDFG